ncbi:diacylglycerol O-acyltransferase 3-2 [Phragmites australis]|uniref:diacylglycerol O-acyltransferase 3-2 n=1 Tax=Phragmites australis TaxID=29695 RepID=UPI002D778E7A|nr:diacylglycerol O-acyltransferase 3-2 [Phragmites australis]
MELTGAVLRPSLPSASPVTARGRRRPPRVSCVGGGFAEEGHLKYYEALAPRKKTLEAVARDLAKIRAMGLAAGDAAKEKVLSEATSLLLQELNQMKDEEYKMKMARKEEKAAIKALKKQQKEAKKAAAAMNCEDESSESSESECDEPIMKIERGMEVSTAVSEVAASGTSTVSIVECEKAAMKAMKKLEKEQKKAAKKAMKLKKEAKKMAMAALNGCEDEDSSSCSSESSDSECGGEVVRMSRCATITAPETPPRSVMFPIIVPQIPESVAPEPSTDTRISSEPATAMQCTTAVVEKPMTNRIEVCMGGKCKKSGSLALLQEFEKVVGTGGTVVGCKCLGKCGLGPNVRLSSEGAAQGSVKRNPLCIGVGLEDVGTIVAGLYGDSDLGMTPT